MSEHGGCRPPTIVTFTLSTLCLRYPTSYLNDLLEQSFTHCGSQYIGGSHCQHFKVEWDETGWDGRGWEGIGENKVE